MKHKWVKSKLSEKLTICMFARDLVDLCYPFVESITSTISLGCEYLIVDAGTDSTCDILNEMGKYIPINVVKMEWPLIKDPGYMAAAMGICTQRAFAECPTDFGLNLQASEIHDNDSIAELSSLKPNEVKPSMFKFRHFYGSMHRGGHGYHGYAEAPRLCRKGEQFDKTDAWCPNNFEPGSWMLINGFVNRYSYCWLNTIRAKSKNKVSLYDDHKPQKDSDCVAFYNTGRDPDNMIYPRDKHPEYVQHLIDLENYDINLSLDIFKRRMY